MTTSRSRLARLCAAGTVVFSLAACGPPADPPRSTSTTVAPPRVTVTPSPVTPAPEFVPVAQLVEDAVAAGRLPGAVVTVGHDGAVVFRGAFGARKLAGEPGLDGRPAPAEPMTEDTLFDLASLTKPLTTATGILQLYERGHVGLDEPVQTYLPDFNPTGDPRRAKVTVRMLLTHTSGIAGDLSLDGPWGLVRADKEEGIRRALGAWVVAEPGERFHYSDIGFIILGALLEKITGEPEDVYIERNVFAPLGMSDTYYLPVAKACGPHRIRGNAIVPDPGGPDPDECADGTWSTELLARVAPTALDEDTPGINPNYGHPLRGTVHDPTARRMGGVAGSAGVFSTAHDLGLYAQALLDRLAGRPSRFPLTRETTTLMTTVQQPGSGRGLGWDIDTAHSGPRGRIFPVGSFGHTGFTGTTLWIDPGSDTYVVVLANVIHVRGGPPITTLSGAVATASARALHLYGN
ncbi:serine hydrolase [Mycolicibacterium chitae]|uniref:serine hydrolase domain-containing protein n=1 Tax=Mycolicibacterium chitae TaxID=1792 RepID=UPI00138C1BEC|nr:serine hydrolase domain-containing protein [Mycolicibacterium chitae]BBZ01926.1 serine hydrolase [Mycolicibacterium chitae]